MSANSNLDLVWFSRETGTELNARPPAGYDLISPSAEKIQQRLVNTAAAVGVQFVDRVTIVGLEQDDSNLFFTLCLDLDNGLQKNITGRSVVLADGGYLNCPSILQNVAPDIEPAPWRLEGSCKGFQLADEMHLDLVQLDQFSYSLKVQANGRWRRQCFPIRPC